MCDVVLFLTKIHDTVKYNFDSFIVYCPFRRVQSQPTDCLCRVRVAGFILRNTLVCDTHAAPVYIKLTTFTVE